MDIKLLGFSLSTYVTKYNNKIFLNLFETYVVFALFGTYMYCTDYKSLLTFTFYICFIFFT